MADNSNELVKLTSNANNVNRRDAFKAVAAVAVVAVLADACVAPDSAPSAGAATTGASSGKFAAGKGPRGTPSDPILINPKLGWDKVLMPAELTTLAALCDTIIPADDKSPAASKVGAPDYINEFVSSPGRDAVLSQVRGGIIWLNGESMTRFQKPFHQLTDEQRVNICDDICFIPKAKPGYVAGAMFFNRVRNLTSGAFYTTPEGWKDIGYIGNVPMETFPGPPAELLQKLGLA